MGRSYGMLAVLVLGLIGVVGYTWQQKAQWLELKPMARPLIEPAAGPASARDMDESMCVTRTQICRIAPVPQDFPCSCYDTFHGNVPGRARLLSADPGLFGGDEDLWLDERTLFDEDLAQ